MELKHPMSINNKKKTRILCNYLEIQLTVPYQPARLAHHPQAEEEELKCTTHQFGSLVPASELVLR